VVSPVAVALTLALLGGACSGPIAEDDSGPSPPARTSTPPAPSPSAPTPTDPPDPSGANIRLAPVATAQQPLALATRPGDPTLYVAQKTGQVVAVRRGRVAKRPVLDLSAEVSQGGEQGLLGLTFSPDGSLLYVNITDLAGDTHVIEFAMRGESVVRRSRRDVLVVDQPYSNHNGGHLAFGPDGYLYVGLGDGGSGGDPEDRAQDLSSLLGKMLRIDPRPRGRQPYRVPPDNPFVGDPEARPEIWAYGLRNPWRYSFDRATGELWIADVGQSAREEIDLQTDPNGGQNYGWDGYEGTLVYEEPVPEPVVEPVHEYGRADGATVIGGSVYRGSAIPDLHGAYVFGDYFNPVLKALVPSKRGFEEVPLNLRVADLSAFGEDGEGELYALSLSGQIYRLVPG
jgi:glucose/arabinose dehydrogenase